jgi:hypothetical protein
MIIMGKHYPIEAIWKRLKKSVALTKIPGATPKQWKKNFIAELKKNAPQSKNLDKIGKKGFFKTAEKKYLLPKQSVYVSRADGKVAVLDAKGKTHLIKSENAKIKESTYKGQKAVYVSNSRTGKRITMKILRGNGNESE